MKKIEGKLNALLENEAIFYGAFSQSVRLHLPKDLFFLLMKIVLIIVSNQ